MMKMLHVNDSNYMTFWQKKNDGDGKEISGLRGWGRLAGEGERSSWSPESVQRMNILYDAIIVVRVITHSSKPIQRTNQE